MDGLISSNSENPKPRPTRTSVIATLPNMLTITDAERLRTVAIPVELAQSVGIFKDMMESVGVGGQSDPALPTDEFAG
jgi:hypothetical protein